MINRKPISVCMATYNGSQYIERQLKSILNQLDERDEVIIVDDCSTDNTVDIINDINSDIIKLIINNRNLKHVKSFEKAIGLASNDYIFLSDQDDIWLEGRVNLMYSELESSYLITGNSLFCSSEESSINFKLDGVKSSTSRATFRNIFMLMLGESSYFGCTMAFKKELIKHILPFPNNIESHDQWIAICANVLNKNKHIDESVLIRRIHDSNESYKYRSLIKKLKTRWIQFSMLFSAYARFLK